MHVGRGSQLRWARGKRRGAMDDDDDMGQHGRVLMIVTGTRCDVHDVDGQ